MVPSNFVAVLLLVLISSFLPSDASDHATGNAETATVVKPAEDTSSRGVLTADSTTHNSSFNTSKPHKSSSADVPLKANPLDAGVYTRAFLVLVALGGVVIIYLGAKAFWRTRRARSVAAQNKKSAATSSTGASHRSPSADADRSALIANDEEEDEESTVFDQSRERLLKTSSRKL